MDISQFSAADLAALKAKLDAMGVSDGRSPLRARQLHDLRLAPRADDPRPTFVWSTEAPRDATDLSRTEPYPRLMWHGVRGEEITVESVEHQARMLKNGYILTAPSNAMAADPVDVLREQLAKLSEADRAQIIEASKQSRLGAIQAQMAALSEADLAAVLASAEASKRKAG